MKHLSDKYKELWIVFFIGILCGMAILAALIVGFGEYTSSGILIH